ncbi:hypothetical protein GCM10023093_00660 [Nemorincola caseinilytica]|uniref:Lipoprotein n=1 Tax=Nemorincola caseinilytica TaxID=2054315 RepID=A0ABP8N455_9BACT
MRTLLSLTAFAGLLLFTSCEKNYVCECTTAANGGNPAVVTNEDLGKMKLSEARAKCKDKEGTVLGVSRTCKLN